MARTKDRDEDKEPLPTIWHASDGLWAEVGRVLAELDPPAKYGPDRVDQRAAFDGVIYRLRTGAQWNVLPDAYGDDSSVHRTYQRWVRRGVLRAVWAAVVRECDELGGVDWEWQAADCCLAKAPLAGRKGGPKAGPTRPTGRRPARSAAR